MITNELKTKETIDERTERDFYKTEKVKDVNGKTFNVKKLIKKTSKKQLLIDKEQYEQMISELQEKLDDVNSMLNSIIIKI